MKRMKKITSMLLLVALLLSCVHVETYAASTAGQMQTNAIQLALGKTKNAKIRAGWDAVYYWVGLTERGKLKVTFTADKIGSDIDMKVYSLENLYWNQTQAFSYSKSKKKTSGTMTTEYVLPKGGYYIMLKADKAMKSAKKISMKVSLTAAGYDDVELNNNEDTAQQMNLSGKKYQMMLSNVFALNDTDQMDCFTFKLKEKRTVSLNMTLKQPVDELMVLVRQKKGDTIETIGNYQMSSTKLKQKLNLGKGTYYVKVLYTGNRTCQIPYTISATADQKVSGITLNKKELKLNVDASAGKTSFALKATVKPTNATNKKISWSSSNPKVAKVSSTGKVTAVSAGKATITAKAKDGSKKTAKCKVTVFAPELKITGSTEMTEGNTQTLTGNASSGKWTSSNPDVLSVSSKSGKTTTVSAKKTGTATITYSAYGKSKKLSVTVKERPKKEEKPQETVAPRISGGTTAHVGSTITFTVTNGVSGATWYSSDASILSGSGSGSSCTMTAHRAGTVSIYCVANGKKSNVITVSVRG